MIMKFEDELEDRLHDHCGVFGVFGATNASELTTLGLYALQHRGQESVGVVSTHYEDKNFSQAKNYGLVNDNMSGGKINSIEGDIAVGHVRYSTSGSKTIEEIQPFVLTENNADSFAIAHNGNLVNAMEVRKDLESKGIVFASNSDTECVIRLMQSYAKKDVLGSFKNSLKEIKGAYAFVAMTKDALIGVRDPNGIRPLCLGKIGESTWVFASETCALDTVGAKFERDVKAGEMVVITKSGVSSEFVFEESQISPKLCVFEHIYFARPDSVMEGVGLYNLRENFGKVLAKRYHVDADIVCPVPDSGVPAALGYAKESAIEFKLGIIRNHYTGRTFINPTQTIRENKVKLKHSPNKDVIKGKRIVLIDDSIVRGTTSKKIVKMLFEAGAAEIHMRISSPPVAHPCFYGIDTPTKEELIINRLNSVEKIREYLGCTSLAYLSVEDLYEAIGLSGNTFCDACFTGKYTI